MVEENYFQEFLGKRVIITTTKNIEYKGRITKLYDSWLWLKRERGKDYLSNQLIDFKDIKEVEKI